MLKDQYLRTSSPNVDPIHVEQLVQAIGSGMERMCIPNVTSTAEILSALFTTLTRVLRGIKQSENPEDAIGNKVEISKALEDLLMEFGATRH